MISRTILLAALVLSGLTITASAADDEKWQKNWPQWRGPFANGTAPTANPPLHWGPKRGIRWKAPVPGAGSSTPVIWEDRIYVTTAVETDRVPDREVEPHPDARTAPPNRIYEFVVLCFDRSTGEPIWKQVAVEAPPHEGLHGSNTYASGSPSTDGERLYVSFGSRGLFGFDLEGNRLWDRDLGDARTRRGWGEAVTPAIADDSLIVNWDTEDESFIVALDPQTGQTRWRRERDEPTGWSTPLVLEHDGRTQVIVNGTNRVRSYDLASGEVLWECGGQTTNAIPSPVYDDLSVYVMSGYRGAAVFALPLTATGDISDTPAIRWRGDRGTPYVPSPILVDGRLYFTQGNSNVLTCLDSQTGETVFGPQRIEGLSNLYASPVAAAGRIYFTSREGNTAVIKAADRYEQLATNRIGELVDASPALVGQELFLRSASHLYCIRGD